MSGCEDVRKQMSAWLDNELDPARTEELRSHVEQCASCQREWEQLQTLDDRLARSLRLDDIERRIHAISKQRGRDHTKVNCTDDNTPRRSRRRLLGLFVVIAASVLVASLVYQRFSTRTDEAIAHRTSPASSAVIARLTRSTGIVQVQAPGESGWSKLEGSSEPELTEGVRVRTIESVLCEIETSDQCKIRLGESGEIRLENASKLDLVKGQLWCRAPEESQLQIDLAGDPKIASLMCPSGSEFQCSVDASRTTSCESASTSNRETEMSYSGGKCVIGPGETVSLRAGGQPDWSTEQADSTKVWQLPLLAIGAPLDDELLLAMKGLLSPIGRTKAMHLNEQQIRALGPGGAIPLLAYVIGERDAQQRHLRRTAVSLARDLADERAIEMLQKLSSDRDEFVSAQATLALERIARDAR